MAFCAKCGSQLSPGAAACSACGAPTGAGPAPAAAHVPPVSTQQAVGFISALFDLSFTNFITTKIIKVLFIISIVMAAAAAIAIIVMGFTASAVAGILALLIVAPLLFLFYVIYSRVFLEILIVIFRCSEYLAEIAKQGRR